MLQDFLEADYATRDAMAATIRNRMVTLLKALYPSDEISINSAGTSEDTMDNIDWNGTQFDIIDGDFNSDKADPANATIQMVLRPKVQNDAE